MEHNPFWADTLITRLLGMGLMLLIVVSGGVFGLDHWLTLGVGVVGILGWILLSLRSVRQAMHKRDRNVR